MNASSIARAWKDEEYRNSLSAEDLAQLPEHPAGSFELSEDDLSNVMGAADSSGAGTLGCCPSTDTVTCSVQCSIELSVLSIVTLITL